MRDEQLTVERPEPPRWSPREDYEVGDLVVSPITVKPTWLGRLLGRREHMRLDVFVCTGHKDGREVWESYP